MTSGKPRAFNPRVRCRLDNLRLGAAPCHSGRNVHTSLCLLQELPSASPRIRIWTAITRRRRATLGRTLPTLAASCSTRRPSLSTAAAHSHLAATAAENSHQINLCLAKIHRLQGNVRCRVLSDLPSHMHAPLAPFPVTDRDVWASLRAPDHLRADDVSKSKLYVYRTINPVHTAFRSLSLQRPKSDTAVPGPGNYHPQHSSIEGHMRDGGASFRSTGPQRVDPAGSSPASGSSTKVCTCIC